MLLNKGFIVVNLKSSLDRGLLLTRKLLSKEFIVVKLKSSLDRGLLLTRKLLNQRFLDPLSSDDFNITTINSYFSSFLVSSSPLSSDDFNLTTMNPLFSSCLVSSNPLVKLKSSLDRGLLLTRKLLN
jgi:hypothetical protein